MSGVRVANVPDHTDQSGARSRLAGRSVGVGRGRGAVPVKKTEQAVEQPAGRTRSRQLVVEGEEFSDQGGAEIERWLHPGGQRIGGRGPAADEPLDRAQHRRGVTDAAVQLGIQLVTGQQTWEQHRGVPFKCQPLERPAQLVGGGARRDEHDRRPAVPPGRPIETAGDRALKRRNVGGVVQPGLSRGDQSSSGYASRRSSPSSAEQCGIRPRSGVHAPERGGTDNPLRRAVQQRVYSLEAGGGGGGTKYVILPPAQPLGLNPDDVQPFGRPAGRARASMIPIRSECWLVCGKRVDGVCRRCGLPIERKYFWVRNVRRCATDGDVDRSSRFPSLDPPDEPARILSFPVSTLPTVS